MLDSIVRVFNRFPLVAGYLSLLIGLSVVSGSARAELLGSISDDTAPVADHAAPAGKKADDRRIIYRVICSPEDQDLPDCERSLDDGNEAGQAATLPMPDLPPDKEDLREAAKQSEPTPPVAEKNKQSVDKKGGKSKKAAKKSSAKSTSGKSKKRPHH